MRQEEASRRESGANGATGASLTQREYTPAATPRNPWSTDARHCDDDALALWRRDVEACIALADEDSGDLTQVAGTIAVANLMLEAIETEQRKRRRAGHQVPSLNRDFTRDALDDIRRQADLVRLFELHVGVDLRRMGTTFRANCPWHNGVSSTSLTVWPDIGGWRCFGCGASGDAFTLWQLAYGCDFVTAVRDVARFAGVSLPEPARPGTVRLAAKAVRHAG